MSRLAWLLALVVLVPAGIPVADEQRDWPAFARDPGATRFSPLTQVTSANVAGLTQVWSFDAGASNLQATPLVVDGRMFFTGGSTVFAVEPETGRQLWRFDASGPVGRRGVAYWPGSGNTGARVLVGVGDGQMAGLDAATGRLVTSFGSAGLVDLKSSVTAGVDSRFQLVSPPTIFKDIIITGGSNGEGQPSTGLYGDIRGWDARTGKLLWSFHTVPREGEPGADTWEGGSWRQRSGTNMWSFMTVDVERGLVFVPTGSPTSDYYGADRKGQNLYGNSIVALDAQSGKLKWFHQLVHHDIWDWDLPAAPTLIDVTRNGRRIPAVAVLTKMSTLFIFDRVTGEPLFGMEERPVPRSEVPGEATWPTQPFPLQPPPLGRIAFDPARDMYSLTPEHAQYCRALWNDNKMYTKGIFTPPGLDGTMVTFPSTLGGGNWGGVSYDAGRGLLITNVMNLGQVARMERRVDEKTGEVSYARTTPWKGSIGRFWNPENKIPCSAPPFGELVAVDVNRGAIAWRVPLGAVDELRARGFDNTGTLHMGGPLTTASGLVFIGATIDKRFRAFSTTTGGLLWETPLEASAHASPMTFLGRDGRQYVVIASGGGSFLGSAAGTKYVAFALAGRTKAAR